MRVTLKEILDELKSFTKKHYQLLEYGMGPLSDLSTADRLFPIMWVEPAQSRMNGTEMILSLDMYILNLELQDKSNLETILNETLLIGNDIISNYFETATIDDEYDLWSIVNDTVTMEPYSFKLDDVLAGWRFNISLSIMNGLNKCELPTK